MSKRRAKCLPVRPCPQPTMLPSTASDASVLAWLRKLHVTLAQGTSYDRRIRSDVQKPSQLPDQGACAVRPLAPRCPCSSGGRGTETGSDKARHHRRGTSTGARLTTLSPAAIRGPAPSSFACSHAPRKEARSRVEKPRKGRLGKSKQPVSCLLGCVPGTPFDVHSSRPSRSLALAGKHCGRPPDSRISTPQVPCSGSWAPG